MKKLFNIIKTYIVDILIIGIFCFLSFYKLDYVIYKTGGTINLSSRIEVNGKKTNNFYMTYVNVSRANPLTYMLSKVIKSWDIEKLSQVTYSGTDYATSLKIDQIEYRNSLEIAKNLACSKSNCEIKNTEKNYYVVGIDEKADTNIELLDEIIGVNGNYSKSLEEFKTSLTQYEIGQKVTINVKVNGKEYERYSHIKEIDGQKVVGVQLVALEKYETNPSIAMSFSNTEAGSSGGLMMTLAIYSSLENMNTNKLKIMGTGTINSEGIVGEIGGIKYKMLGAKKAKCDIFFVPKDNYEEAKEIYKRYKLKYDLVEVSTLDDAINYLNSII